MMTGCGGSGWRDRLAGFVPRDVAYRVTFAVQASGIRMLRLLQF
jgi:hypothetical protein